MKKEAFRAWLARGSPEAAAVVTEAKTLAWGQFGETMEEDLRSASRRFWQTIRQLRKGRQGLPQDVLSRGGGAADPDGGHHRAVVRAL